MRIATTAATVLTALALVACSSTSNGDPTTAPSSTVQTPSSSGESSPTGFPSTSSSSSQPPSTGGLSEAEAQAALLTEAEVGSGFTQTEPDDSDSPLPCAPNEPSLSEQFPADVKVQADFGGAQGKALFSEEIETYADEATLAQVISTGERGLSCPTATVGGMTVTIDGPTDLTTEIPVTNDKAEAWVLKSTAVNSSLIIVAIDTQLVVFSLTGDPSVDQSQLPDAQTLITKALEKVQAALK